MKLPAYCRAGAATASHPARGAWIEIGTTKLTVTPGKSHPARGAWIEMVAAPKMPSAAPVAPRKGCVD